MKRRNRIRAQYLQHHYPTWNDMKFTAFAQVDSWAHLPLSYAHTTKSFVCSWVTWTYVILSASMFDDQHIGGLYATDIHDSSSVISHDSDDFSITSNTSIPHETYSDTIQHWPLEKWIHTRFCLTYPVHSWAHDRLVRVLLFGPYCHRQLCRRHCFPQLYCGI